MVKDFYSPPSSTRAQMIPLFFYPKNQKREGGTAVQLQWSAVNKQENTTTKQNAAHKIHTNELHANFGHPREGRISATENYLHYRVKGTVEVCEEFATAKSKNKFIHEVVEECNLEPGKMIYLYLSSKNKPSYGVFNNWVLIQDSYTKTLSFFTKAKHYFTEKFSLFINKIEDNKETFQTFFCDN